MSVYEAVLQFEPRRAGLQVRRRVPIPIRYDEIQRDEGFRADLIGEEKVLVELKSVEELTRVHKTQVLTYLRLTGLRLGLPINFGAARIKDGIDQVVNGLYD